MPPPKTLVFHIGDPKTGSSSIQQALFGRTWSSPTQRIAYPDGLTSIPLAKSLYADAPPDQREKRFAATADWLNRQTGDIAVLSAEHFSFIPPTTLKSAIEQFLPDHAGNIQVIAYVRPHIPRLISTFAQRVKTRGLKKPFESFCQATAEKGQFRYTPRFVAWRDTFGAGFTLRPMLRPLLWRQDVVADFLYNVLGSDDFTTDPTRDQNASPTLYHLACLLLVQSALRQADIAQDLRHALCSRLAERLARDATPADARLKMPRPLLARMQDAHRDDAAALDEAFFTDFNGFTGTPFSTALETAALTATDEPQSIAAKDHFSASQRQALDRIVTEIIHQLHADPTSWKRHYRQAKTNKSGSNQANPASAIRIETLLGDICAVLS